MPNTWCACIYFKVREIQYLCVNTMGWGRSIYLEYFTIFNGKEHSSNSQSVLIIILNLRLKTKQKTYLLTKKSYTNLQLICKKKNAIG